MKGRKIDVSAPLLSVQDKLKKADRQGSYGCPSGQFPNAGFSGCYSCPDGYKHNPVFAVSTKGVCVKSLTSLATADRQGSYGCPGNQFPNAKLDACYSCPDGYRHNSLLPVDTSGVCERSTDYKLQCSLVPSPPATTPKTLGGLNTGQNLLGNLAAALSTEGVGAQIEVAGLITAFSAGFALQKDPVVELAAITPAGPVCGWIIENGISGSGALNDCASESARFMDALWNNMSAKAQLSVIRIATYEYAVVKDGQVLHRNWHRLKCSSSPLEACSATNDQCIDDDCRQASADCRTPPAAPPALANIYISDGVSSVGRMLSVPEDGSRSDLYKVDDGSGRQRWRLQRSADGVTYNLVIDGGVRAGRKYLSTRSDGSAVDLYTSDDGSGRQRWRLQLSPDGLSYNLIISGGVNGPNRYLSVKSDGSLVDLYSSDEGSGRQRWTLRAR